ncbi:MAG: hypothetical protein ACHQUB_02990 [Candidatus Saccharimonadia bacterium]
MHLRRITRSNRLRYCLRALRNTASGVLVLCALGSIVRAEASQVNISQGYTVSGSVVEGTLVSNDQNAANTVVPANSGNGDSLVGVVVQNSESLLSVNSSGNQTQVATSGVAYALVSTINGDIKAGDRVSASPIDGIGMKADPGTRILGVAQTAIASASDLTSLAVKDKNGQPTTVKVGHILVLVDVSFYGNTSGGANSGIPAVLQNISNTIAGKPVSTARVIISGLLLIIALVISVSLVYSAVRNSIVSIGRNPLSQPAVRKGLAQVLVFVGVILLVTLISIYFILSR